MENSEIKFTIQLDAQRVPEKITWDATEKSGNDLQETKAINISLWDHIQKNTLRIDLWTKEMPVLEMKRFYTETLGGMAQNILQSTGDEFMAKELKTLCDKLVTYLEKESDL